MINKYPKKHLLPPEAGPTPQGLNINYNTVKTVKQSGEKINGGYRQSTSKRIQENEDGSVDIDLDPQAASPEGGDEHYANLAEFLPDDVLGRLGSDLNGKYMDYTSSRKEWEQAYIQGLDLLGFKYNNRTEPFQGASGATHPVLAEAVTQFQALAYKELLPSGGPVRTQVMGLSTPEKTQQATRVKDFMNYEIMEKMKEYEPEFDQMLFNLPLAGSAFKKVYYDDMEQRQLFIE